MRAPINRLESIWPRSKSLDTPAGREKESWAEQAKSWERSLEDLLAEYPKAAIATAAAIGIALGWMVKRK